MWAWGLGYSLVGLVIFCGFLYFHFPFSHLEKAWLNALSARTGCEVEIQSRQQRFLRFIWRGIRIDCPYAGSPYWITVMALNVRPLPLLWGGEGTLHLDASLPQGQIRGETAFLLTGGTLAHFQYHGEAIDLQPFGIAGQMNFNVSGHLRDSDRPSETGRLSFTLQNLHLTKIGTGTSLLGALSFPDVSGLLSLHDNVLTFERFVAHGNPLDLSLLHGSITLRDPLGQSGLSIMLQAIPKGGLKTVASLFVPHYPGAGPISIVLSGPISSPHMRMNERQISPSLVRNPAWF